VVLPPKEDGHMGGSAFDIITSIGSLALGSIGSSSRNRGSSAADMARARAEEEARRRAENRRKREEESQEAAERERNRVARMRGQASTLATGGAGLLDPAPVAKPGLKTRLGE